MCCSMDKFPCFCLSLAVALLASTVSFPTRAIAAENACGAGAAAIVQKAYPDATPVPVQDYRTADGASITLPEGDTISFDPHAMICRHWPARPEILLVAVPLLYAQADHGNEGDLELLALDSDSHAVLARLRLKDMMTDDALMITGVAFDTAPWRLAPDRIAFGLRISVRGSSRANPFHETTLRLFEPDGNTLRPILDAIRVESGGGEWDTNCAGAFLAEKRTLAISSQTHHGVADIVVTTRASDRITAEHNGQCEDVETARPTTSDRLRFDGTRYSVPETLRP